MASIAENISRVREQIGKAALDCGRSPASITMMAVSKTQSSESVREAYEAGQRDFGENYLQEALGKIDALPLPDLCWHFIGPIQSNKTREIAEHFDWVHSIDRVKIAQRLSAQRPLERGPLNVCIQVNISEEASKSGVALADVMPLCAAIHGLENISLRGLMAIPAPCDDPQQQRLAFRPLGQLFQHLTTLYPQMDTLSLGMSADYAAAIAEGSTLLRIGSAIFGMRS